jgi:hypothetical protein
VVDTYLTLLGAALAGLVVLVTVFVATTARTPTRGWSRSTVLAAASGSVIIILGLGTMGLAAALLASIAGNVWLASRAPSAHVVPSPSTAAAPVAPTAASAPAATTLRADPGTAFDPRPNARPAPIPTVALTAGLLRGEGSLTRVSPPPDAQVVALLIALAADEYATYRAALTNEDSDAIWSAATLRAEGPSGRRAVRLLVPTSLLPRGDYRVDLDGVREREPERIGSYTFRVTGP